MRRYSMKIVAVVGAHADIEAGSAAVREVFTMTSFKIQVLAPKKIILYSRQTIGVRAHAQTARAAPG